MFCQCEWRKDAEVSKRFAGQKCIRCGLLFLTDTERIDALQRSLSSVQFNTRQMKWTVQLPGQVIGKIGAGSTIRDAIDDAIIRDLKRINEASEES